ncbi:hypothetical protein GCM10023144_41900 [Pigmentiphaga soli]|uniref:Uncharacterized protein n=1 Tax=Pigmentiphaga soli TaxID=1007095 RepID=A0ABP8HMV6_9BURK
MAGMVGRREGKKNYICFIRGITFLNIGRWQGRLAAAIDGELGGFDQFKDAFTKAALTLRQRPGVAERDAAKETGGGK